MAHRGQAQTGQETIVSRSVSCNREFAFANHIHLPLGSSPLSRHRSEVFRFGDKPANTEPATAGTLWDREGCRCWTLFFHGVRARPAAELASKTSGDETERNLQAAVAPR